MNQDISIYQFKNRPIRVFRDPQGESWWLARDICEVLQIKNHRDALGKLDSDEKGVVLTDTPGGAQQMVTINEPGMYRLIMRSRKVEAQEFQRWVSHEVIPAIRKRGYFYKYSGGDGNLSVVEMMLGLAGHIGSLEQRVNKLEEKDRKIAGLLAPAPEAAPAPVKEIPTRGKINQLIRGYAEKTGMPYQEIWEQLYYQFKYRYNVDLWQRVQNSKAKTALDIAESMGCLGDLYTLAQAIFLEGRR